jgi:hypothetical protein
MGDWSTRTTWNEVQRRAAGRNRINAVRRLRAVLRRGEVVQLLKTFRVFNRGSQAEIARRLGVSEATISRDVKLLLFSSRPCPTCGGLRNPDLGLKPIRTGRRAV